MPPVPTITADGVKICELAREKYGSVSRFAEAIGRHPSSIWNLRQIDRPDRNLSVTFAQDIADALGVTVAEITLRKAAA
jgi:hypothetical protein